MFYEDKFLGTATGFIVERNGSYYLISNYHVLAGRNPKTGQSIDPTGAWPNRVGVIQNVAGSLGCWHLVFEVVRDDNGPLWLEHPTHGRTVDVVALELNHTRGVEFYPYGLEDSTDIRIGVSQQVSIIGFPFGKTGGGVFGIWVQGTIATEPDIMYDELPCFLIDSRTREGLSGSPVIFFSQGGVVPKYSGTALYSGPVEVFLGVYSGRINEQSDLGYVWRRSAISEIIDAQVRGVD